MRAIPSWKDTDALETIEKKLRKDKKFIKHCVNKVLNSYCSVDLYNAHDRYLTKKRG